MSVAVVVPTIREACLARFLAEWADDLAGVRLIVGEDNPERTFPAPAGVEHYCWADVERALGEAAWIIPRRTSAQRSFGIWRAWRGGADVIWTLDDDCYPEAGRRGTYVAGVEKALSADAPQGQWFNTINGWAVPRGFPYGIRDQRRPVMVHHGLWSNVPDLDGLTQRAMPDLRLPPAGHAEVVPVGQFFPMCVMNLAFRAELAPAMYMLLMGQDAAGRRWGFDRFDDIWAGLFVKRICDHLGYAITSGAPSVHHAKASKAEDNIRLEAAGIEVHETFWPHIAAAALTESTVAGCYAELADAVARFSDGRYWRRLAAAMAAWAGLFT